VLIYNSPLIFVKLLFGTIRANAKMYKAERKTSRMEIEELAMQTKLLRAQLNPHFLFNTFNNLYGLALSKEERLPGIILRLSDIMRYLTYEANTEKVPLAKELAFIKDYVLVEKIRFDDDKKIVLDMDESDTEGLYIAPLLTFTFIENAFKYGLKSRTNKFLEIKIFVVEKTFDFYIINDKNIATGEKQETSGIGIENVRKRLELLYPGKHQLLIENGEDSFGIKLQIKLDDG
jgi:LytS/YehU family sensor histidine kinase